MNATTPKLPTLEDQMNFRENADYVECDACETGVVERVFAEVTDNGAAYDYINGCSGDRISAYCAACTAAGKVA